MFRHRETPLFPNLVYINYLMNLKTESLIVIVCVMLDEDFSSQKLQYNT